MKEPGLAESLRTLENEFNGVFETSPIGMAIVALNGTWVRVNPALLSILGYTKEELYQHTFQHITHPEDLATDIKWVNALIAGEHERYQMEKRYFNREGFIVWVLLSVSIVRNEKGQPLHFVAQIVDLTEQKNQARQRIAEMDKYHSRMALELHENIAQTVASIKLYLSSASVARHFEPNTHADVEGQLTALIAEITALSDRVMPTTFLSENLFDMVQGMVVKYTVTNNIRADLKIDNRLKNVSFVTSYHIFRIVEDLTKLAILRDATFLRVRITRMKHIQIAVKTNGGTPQNGSAQQQRLLIDNVTTRLDMLNGTVIKNTFPLFSSHCQFIVPYLAERL